MVNHKTNPMIRRWAQDAQSFVPVPQISSETSSGDVVLSFKYSFQLAQPAPFLLGLEDRSLAALLSSICGLKGTNHKNPKGFELRNINYPHVQEAKRHPCPVDPFALTTFGRIQKPSSGNNGERSILRPVGEQPQLLLTMDSVLLFLVLLSSDIFFFCLFLLQ